MINVKEFLEKLERLAETKTLYVNAAFGAPATTKNKARYAALSANANRVSSINKATSDVFFFDCCGMVKAILWGFDWSKNKTYGGATYKSNGVPDFNENEITNCLNVSTDIKTVKPGEFLYMKGHCGIYKGDGLVIECSPAWKNGVQITKISDRKWIKHGQLKYVNYEAVKEPAPQVTPKPTRTYTVKKGDSLWTIAKNELKNAMRWPEIQRLNNLPNSLIRVGQVLKLPED